METEGQRVAAPGEAQRQGELQRSPAQRALQADVFARAIGAQAAGLIADAIHDRVEQLDAHIATLNERLAEHGPTTSTGRRVLSEVRYWDGYVDALSQVHRNFVDSKETRRGRIFV